MSERLIPNMIRWPKGLYTGGSRAPETRQQTMIRHIRQTYAGHCLAHLRTIKSPNEPRYDMAMKWFQVWLRALDREYEQAGSRGALDDRRPSPPALYRDPDAAENPILHEPG